MPRNQSRAGQRARAVQKATGRTSKYTELLRAKPGPRGARRKAVHAEPARRPRRPPGRLTHADRPAAPRRAAPSPAATPGANGPGPAPHRRGSRKGTRPRPHTAPRQGARPTAGQRPALPVEVLLRTRPAHGCAPPGPS
ncbi:hypothetical protein QFZ82_000316 [Streptomyces sp. V4I23]|nr:hypothetical protein [Streptomyces sp. V4I23]